jgi:hypothetical protein
MDTSWGQIRHVLADEFSDLSDTGRLVEICVRLAVAGMLGSWVGSADGSARRRGHGLTCSWRWEPPSLP